MQRSSSDDVRFSLDELSFQIPHLRLRGREAMPTLLHPSTGGVGRHYDRERPIRLVPESIDGSLKCSGHRITIGLGSLTATLPRPPKPPLDNDSVKPVEPTESLIEVTDHPIVRTSESKREWLVAVTVSIGQGDLPCLV